MLEGLLLPWQQIYHLAFLFNFRTTPEASSKLYFVEICHSQRNYGFLITKELIFGFQILDLKDHLSASLSPVNLLYSSLQNQEDFLTCEPSFKIFGHQVLLSTLNSGKLSNATFFV